MTDFNKPKFIMMVGVPMSGKDSWIGQNFDFQGTSSADLGLYKRKSDGATFNVISTDNEVYTVGCKHCVTSDLQGRDEYVRYQDVMTYDDWHPKDKPVSDLYREAIDEVDKKLDEAIAAGKNILFNRTNTTQQERAAVIEKLGDKYDVEAVVMVPSSEEIASRYERSNPKEIPGFVMASKMKKFEMPTKEEGFSHIHINPPTRPTIFPGMAGERYAPSEFIKKNQAVIDSSVFRGVEAVQKYDELAAAQVRGQSR